MRSAPVYRSYRKRPSTPAMAGACFRRCSLAPRRELLLALLTIAAFPLTAATLITRTGTPAGSFAGVTSLAASWTQTGTTYSGVTVVVMVQSTNGAPANATAYLTNALGGAGPAICSRSRPSRFRRLSPLPSPSHFLRLLSPRPHTISCFPMPPRISAGRLWRAVVEALGPGVTSNIDRVDLATPTPAFPPSAATFQPASAGGLPRSCCFPSRELPARH